MDASLAVFIRYTHLGGLDSPRGPPSARALHPLALCGLRAARAGCQAAGQTGWKPRELRPSETSVQALAHPRRGAGAVLLSAFAEPTLEADV